MFGDFGTVNNNDFEWLLDRHYSCTAEMVPEYRPHVIANTLEEVNSHMRSLANKLQLSRGHTEPTCMLEKVNTASLLRSRKPHEGSRKSRQYGHVVCGMAIRALLF